MNENKGIRDKDLKILKRHNFSPIPLNGKKPFQFGWESHCTQKFPVRKSEFEGRNAGIPTGPANGVIVLDVDDFWEMFCLRIKNGWDTPETFCVTTGSGNHHHYYKYPDDGEFYGCKSYNDPSSKKHVFDIKGIGGVVVAAGSIHPDTGKRYKITNDVPFAPAPQWLLDYLRKEKKHPSVPIQKHDSTGEKHPKILTKLQNVRETGPEKWKATCPAHDDKDPSLSISVGIDGRTLIHCFADCESEAILEALGMRWSDLFPTALAAANDLVRQINETKDSRQVFNNAPLLAELDTASLSKIKTDLKSILGNELNLNDFTKAVNESKLQIVPSDDHPAIGVTNRPPRDIMEDSLNVVYKTNSPPTIFVRGGELVRYRSDEKGLPMIEQLNEAILTGILTERANFFSGEKTLKHTPPPFGIIKTILAAGTWDFPALEALIETPLIRKDGTIVSEPGYDPITGSLLHLDKNLQSFNVPQNPSKRDIKRSIKLILEEILVDFPFVDDRSKANAVALLLTPFIIPILDSPTPMAVIDAPSQGSGKGLLAIITSIVATGREVPMMNETTEEERRKRITTELYKGCTAIMIDNVTGEIKSDALATVLTSSYWSDRLLGGNRSVRLRNGVTWMMSGNNVKLGGDLPRRCYWIKLDAKVARPHLRKGFKHKNLISWVTKRRQKIMTALLTIVRAWFVAGKPKASIPSFGSYREWSNIIGGILQFVGIEGFLENMGTFMDRVDEESSQWHAFLRMLKKRFKKRAFTSSDIARLVRENNELLADFPDLLGAAFKDPHASFERKLGKSISQKVDVRYGKRNLRLEWVDKRGHVNRWRVVMDPQKD